VAIEEVLFLFLAGVVGAIVSVLVSLASLVTYPALLATGLAPVAANVTNTVSLVFAGLGATIGSRRELHDQRPQLLRLGAVGALGGLTGAVLLLALPGRLFELVAPVLVAGASLTLLVQPRVRDRPLFRPDGLRPGRLVAFFLVTLYAGYFGAAGGILALVVLGSIIARPFIQVNAAKNVLMGIANGAAAVLFILAGPVAWTHVVPLAAGLFTGGLIGPAIARRVPGPLLRLVVAACGLVVAAVLAWRTYL
jgi:uncharacterized membrane protein YfcA